jgi:ADP-dependent NAD(P)H-hydrate dehydratase
MTVKRGNARPTRITGGLLRKWPLPKVHPKLGKDGRGDVLVVGGSQEIPGAVVLAAVGALRAGAGKLQIATARAVAGLVAVTVPEARVIGLPQTRKGELARGCARLLGAEMTACDALLVGPGMVDPGAAIDLLKHCTPARPSSSFIIDAAALHAFDGRKALASARQDRFIITPHAGEMACLWGCSRSEVLADPLAIARQCAAKLGVIVTLKGAQTYVVAPDGAAYHNTAGNIGLGTSGSGDTLSGVIAGLSARGAEPLQAAVWGVYLHARAGDVLARRMGPLGFLARELLTEIPSLLTRVIA